MILDDQLVLHEIVLTALCERFDQILALKDLDNVYLLLIYKFKKQIPCLTLVRPSFFLTEAVDITGR